MTSIEYANNRGPDLSDTNDIGPNAGGIILGFNKLILPLVRQIDVDDIVEEPEVVLFKAPPIESVVAVYPTDTVALSSLKAALESLRR